MVKNKLGKKVIGTALSIAMAITAIPAMTSLACERVPEGNFGVIREHNSYYENEDRVPDYGTYKHAYAAGPLADITLDELIARFTEVADYYYQNESKIPMGLHPQSEATLNYVSRVMRDPDSRPDDYAIANNDLESLNRTVEFFADSDMPLVENGLLIAADDTEVREAALSDLYDTLYEMADFYEVFENEIASAVGTDTFVSWVDFGMDVYCDNEAFSIEEIDNLNETLQNIYASTIDAIDAASQPAEEIAPDYGMNLDEENSEDELVIDHQDDFTISPDFEIDPQDSFTIEGEEPASEDEFVAPDYGMDLDEDASSIEIADDISTNEDPATETTSEAAPAVSAPVAAPAAVAAPSASVSPATQVLGAVRDRRAIADEIVEGLYNNVLNRASDASGRTFWVNTILADEDNLDMVITSFVTSTEFNARKLNDDEFVALLYRVILNRAPSASEKNLWMSALSNGATRGEVVNAFVNSSEFDRVSDAYGL